MRLSRPPVRRKGCYFSFRRADRRSREAEVKKLIGNPGFHVKRMQVIQTDAERRRREAGVQQWMENGLGSCMYICVYVYMFV